MPCSGYSTAKNTAPPSPRVCHVRRHGVCREDRRTILRARQITLRTRAASLPMLRRQKGPANKTPWRLKRWLWQTLCHLQGQQTHTMYSPRPGRVGPRLGRYQRCRLRRTHLGCGYVKLQRRPHVSRVRIEKRPGDGAGRTKGTNR